MCVALMVDRFADLSINRQIASLHAVLRDVLHFTRENRNWSNLSPLKRDVEM